LQSQLLSGRRSAYAEFISGSEMTVALLFVSNQ